MKRIFVIDMTATAAICGVLYYVGAPWWSYWAMSAFGLAQRLIGREQVRLKH